MEPVGFVYVAIFRFYFGTAAISNLSTQPTHNNPISTTRPISNLYTQPSAIFHRRPVSKKSLNTKNPRAGTTRRQFPTPGNPLYSTLFQFFISPPVTSILPSQHVLSLTLEYTSFTLSLTSEHIFFTLSPTPADFPNRFFAFPISFLNPVLYMKVIL